MLYCDAGELRQYVLQQYLDAVEDQAPGSVMLQIEAVSAEIDEALAQGGCQVPEGAVSATLKRICAVMAAWRSIGQITSLMASEGSTGNEWIPLQKLHARAERELDQVRAGRLDPFPEAKADAGISVSTNKALFGRGRWEAF